MGCRVCGHSLTMPFISKPKHEGFPHNLSMFARSAQQPGPCKAGVKWLKKRIGRHCNQN
ncbi:uncharacterized protein CIMG_10862 [Coccidioides immitis RS]|uniref:Uncharacterized protein n=3 Tax=Coccidioides immitis TaxID=5501 RepID=A0A0D8JSF4_COCIM|nr:uncharacterized protein CIMG_10862 [Coccidioides immitis RS]KJF60074.1 hypothetical protein CIMG_10862 [Coccidioides immitis RS]KMP02067.1 hypothetical protein CIRG_02206 [Coccidioides immitis RMSCC 2394]KMU79824.1 hypothetical protein CISG_08104 [Coccidioides immitis RMSCC 3703]